MFTHIGMKEKSAYTLFCLTDIIKITSTVISREFTFVND